MTENLVSFNEIKAEIKRQQDRLIALGPMNANAAILSTSIADLIGLLNNYPTKLLWISSDAR